MEKIKIKYGLVVGKDHKEGTIEIEPKPIQEE